MYRFFSASRLLLERRIKEAQVYLKLHRHLSVTRIASLCGFHDSNYFSTCFRRIAGCSPREYRAGPLRVCPAQRIVQVDDADITLTNKEFELLCLLLENQGIVLARATLMDRVWGMELERENRTLDVHVRTLRAKLGPAGGLIETVRGVGYRLEVQP